MRLGDDDCYRALVARDARFDGLFFVGVASTRIYCRPVCPARKPRRGHCRFFPTAAAAEQAGFRPCLRCRPERAPGTAPCDPAARATPGVVARIRAGALNGGGNVDELAHEFGLSARQLRRQLRTDTGVSPVELAQSCRLLLAKQLLTESRLPVTRVALASGYASLRRFNQAFAAHYRLAPSQLRQRRDRLPAADVLQLRLEYRPPLNWPALLAFLAPRAIPGVELVAEDGYARTVAVDRLRGWLRVTPDGARNALVVQLSAGLAAALQPMLERVRDLFDLHARPALIDAHLAACPHLRPLVQRRPGLRTPGAFDGFELAWRAVLGQQVSVRAATTLAGRFVTTFGERVETSWPALTHCGPAAAHVARATAAAIARIGIPRARARTLQALARLATDRPALFEPGPPVARTLAELERLPGVGPWTAQYVALRALRWPDAFPAGDLGLRRALQRLEVRDPAPVAQAWRPWRSYAALHLWTHLAEGDA